MKKNILTIFILLLIFFIYTLQVRAAETDRFFTGQRQIDEIGVYNFGARFYSPTLGIFIQPDRIEGANRYMYAGNNPVSMYDPGGNVVAPGNLFPKFDNHPVIPADWRSNPIAWVDAKI